MLFAFGDHEVDDERFELRCLGRPVDVQPKVLELLVHLLRNRDRMVPKEELLSVVWPDSVVTDNSLARAVSLARHAIGDREAPSTTIVNVPRRGYRFQAPVQVSTSDPALSKSASRYAGREHLLARLGETLDSALSGSGTILMLVGEAGIGKTRTAEILAERARLSGAEVATAWGLEGGAPTYWAWARALRELIAAVPQLITTLSSPQLTDLARLLPEISSTAPAASSQDAPRGDDALRARLFEVVQLVLRRAALRRPLALFLDDLHRADAESLWLLEFVGQSIGNLPFAIVITSREDAGNHAPTLVRINERIVRLPALQRWPLAALDAAEVGEFVRLFLGRDGEPALLAALVRQTGGNPLLLGESLRSLDARGLLANPRKTSEWEAQLPVGIRHLLQPKLRRLSPSALTVLGYAAAIGLQADRELLKRCVPEVIELDACLQEAEAAELLAANGARSVLRFSHVLVRDALYDDLVRAGDFRRTLHSHIASALERLGSTSAESLSAWAHHCCEAVPLVDPMNAAESALLAAEHSALLHDFEGAAAWCQRALGVLGTGDPHATDVRARIYLSLGDAQIRAVGVEQARNSFRRAADLARSIGRADLLISAALGFAHRPNATGNGDPEVIEILEEADQLSHAESASRRIRVTSRLASEIRYHEPARAEALMATAVSAARELADPAVLALALDDCSFLRWSPSDPEGWIALNGEIVRAAMAANDLELALLGQKGRVTGFLELGDIASVDREFRACERIADELRTPYARWLCVALRGMRPLLDGDLDAVERHVRDSIVLGECVDSLDVALELQAQLVCLRLEQGRLEEVESAVRTQVQRFPDAPAWRAALAHVLAATGRSDQARVELRRLARGDFLDVPRDRGWLPTLALAAEVAYATRDEAAAVLLERQLGSYARLAVVAGSGLLYYGSVAHHLGLLAATQSRWADAVALFESALLAHQRVRARLWEARTRLALAEALQARATRSDRARGAEMVAQALAEAEANGWTAITAAARQLESSLWATRSSSRNGSPRDRSQSGSG